MPSLNPNMLRGVTWVVLVDDVRPNPSCYHRTETTPKPEPHQVAHRVHRHLRVVGAGLDAEVAARARRVEVVAEERREVLQRRRPAVGQPEPVVEQGRPEADGDRQA